HVPSSRSRRIGMTPTCEVRDLTRALDEWRVRRIGRAFETQSGGNAGWVNSYLGYLDFFS
ncbi:MAG: hypothetical protein AABZ61_01895, partial [Bacteroidota bacterium]